MSDCYYQYIYRAFMWSLAGWQAGCCCCLLRIQLIHHFTTIIIYVVNFYCNITSTMWRYRCFLSIYCLIFSRCGFIDTSILCACAIELSNHLLLLIRLVKCLFNTCSFFSLFSFIVCYLANMMPMCIATFSSTLRCQVSFISLDHFLFTCDVHTVHCTVDNIPKVVGLTNVFVIFATLLPWLNVEIGKKKLEYLSLKLTCLHTKKSPTSAAKSCENCTHVQRNAQT